MPWEKCSRAHGEDGGLYQAGAFLFPDFLAVTHGINRAMVIAGVVAVAGLLLTFALLPETKGKSLEQLEEDAYAEAPAKAGLGVQPA